MSAPQKYRQRKRLQRVDRLVETLSTALEKQGGDTIAAIERWKAEMPTEAEMEAKDKYTLFDRKAREYRKGVHSMLSPRRVGGAWMELILGIEVPKWTRVSQRVNPPGY
jgi:hypothetical protein